MTAHTPAPENTSGYLLSNTDRTICTTISLSDTPDTSQRATALLLLDAGKTQAEAATETGLSIGQVRYLVKRYREKGIDIFPAESRNGSMARIESITADNRKDESQPDAYDREETPTTLPPERQEGNKRKQQGNKKKQKKRPKRPKSLRKKKKSKRKRKKK